MDVRYIFIFTLIGTALLTDRVYNQLSEDVNPTKGSSLKKIRSFFTRSKNAGYDSGISTTENASIISNDWLSASEDNISIQTEQGSRTAFFLCMSIIVISFV
ncbi:hypothetical protein P3W45_001069 [Vairimorpha bombi]